MPVNSERARSCAKFTTAIDQRRMENGLACLATKLIALLADEEITEKQAPRGWGELATLASRAKTRKHSLTSFAPYLPCSSTVRAVPWKLQTPTSLQSYALRLRRVLRRHDLLQRDYPRERNAENVYSGNLERWSYTQKALWSAWNIVLANKTSVVLAEFHGNGLFVNCSHGNIIRQKQSILSWPAPVRYANCNYLFALPWETRIIRNIRNQSDRARHY